METLTNAAIMNVHNHRTYGTKINEAPNPTNSNEFNFNRQEAAETIKGENVAYIYAFDAFPDLVKVFFSTDINGYLSSAASYIPNMAGTILFDMGPFPVGNKKLGTYLNIGLAGANIYPINNVATGTWFKKENLETLKRALTAFHLENR